jgi:hypothetical protein
MKLGHKRKLPVAIRKAREELEKLDVKRKREEAKREREEQEQEETHKMQQKLGSIEREQQLARAKARSRIDKQAARAGSNQTDDKPFNAQGAMSKPETIQKEQHQTVDLPKGKEFAAFISMYHTCTNLHLNTYMYHV